MKHHSLSRTRVALGIGALLLAGCNDNDSTPKPAQPTLGHRTVSLIEQDGLQFKDLDGSGTLTPYEDWRLGAAERARDLVGRLSLAQKAGLMMHGTLVLDADGRVNLTAMDKMLREDGVNTFITRMAGDPAAIADDNNRLQALLEGVGLGIPMTVSTDPRNHFTHDPNATSIGAGAFSQWPETLGLAAIGDAALVQRFGDIARQEYRAVGIHEALSPQADLATEPRWGRINGTFGEDNLLAKSLVKAYIEGFQQGSDGIGKENVVTVVKHFTGAGPQKNGLDAHNPWGKEQVYPGGQFAYHLVPFEGAFEAKVGAVMPYYALPEGLTYEGQAIEEVGFGFNRQILTDLLRGHFKFDGVVLSDWGIVNDCDSRCEQGLTQDEVTAGVSPWTVPFGMSWGVEKLTKAERYAKAIDAGVDQFGGVEDPAPLLAAVQSGLVTEAAITTSAERILEQKFALGLFENPYVDTQAAVALGGKAGFQQEAQAAGDAVNYGGDEVIVVLHVQQHHTQYGAVGGNQGQIHTQRLVQVGHERLQHHLHDGNKRCDDNDVARQMHLGRDDLAQCRDNDVGADQNERHGQAHAHSAGNGGGDSQCGAAAQHQAQNGVLTDDARGKNLPLARFFVHRYCTLLISLL